MADKTVIGGVISHRNTAAFAGKNILAFGALNKGVIPSAVHKKNGLFVFFGVFRYFRGKRGADNIAVALGKFAGHIADKHFGKRSAVIPFAQDGKPYPALLRLVKTFKGRGGGSGEQERLFFVNTVARNGFCVVTGRFFGFVSMLLFLVHDNKTEIFERGENGASGADDESGIARAYAFVLVIAFADGKPAVQNRKQVAVAADKAVYYLQSKRYFG